MSVASNKSGAYARRLAIDISNNKNALVIFSKSWATRLSLYYKVTAAVVIKQTHICTFSSDLMSGHKHLTSFVEVAPPTTLC